MSLSHPREIFKPVIVHSAYSFILVHDHPSGDPSASDADMRLTRRILEGSRILQLHLVDHVIIGMPAPKRNSYFSFKEGWRHFMTPRSSSRYPCMRFTRYPKGEAYQTTPRKLAAARRAVQREKDRYPLFPELLKHQTAEDRLTSIAVEQEAWWQEMRERQAQLWRKARQALRDLPPGPRAAIKRYWKICGCPGDPVYLLTLIHEHRARKVCYWLLMADLRRLRLRFYKSR